MSNLIQPTVVIDSSGLNRGLFYANQYRKTAPADSANTAAFFVAVATRNDTPFVTPETIDAELAVEVLVEKIGKRGGLLKNPHKRFSAKTTSANPEVPLAVLIIQARANPQSRYNQLTNSRYALTASPFKGVSRQAGRMAMADMVHKMIANRHKSGHFLFAGWQAVVKKMRKFAKLKYASTSVGNVNRSYGESDLGNASPAFRGSDLAVCVIENDVGLEGENAESHNRALLEYSGPALQRALDNQGKREMQFYLDKSGANEFFAPINSAWK